MKKLNKVLALVLAMVMALSLAACSGGNNSTNNTANAGANNTANNTADNSGDTESTDSGNKLIAGVVFQEDQFFKLLSAGYQLSLIHICPGLRNPSGPGVLFRCPLP